MIFLDKLFIHLFVYNSCTLGNQNFIETFVLNLSEVQRGQVSGCQDSHADDSALRLSMKTLSEVVF